MRGVVIITTRKCPGRPLCLEDALDQTAIRPAVRHPSPAGRGNYFLVGHGLVQGIRD